MNDVRRRPAAGALAALALAFLGTAWSAARGAEESTAPEPLEAELILIRNLIINARSKLNNDVVGFATTDGAPATPGRSCCSGNLEQIDAALQEASRILTEFDRCYEKDGNPDMVLHARVTQSDLATFARSLPQFADAGTKPLAQEALRSMSRAYNAMRDTALGLATCRDVARRPVAEPEASAKSKKDKTNKRGKDKQGDAGKR